MFNVECWMLKVPDKFNPERKSGVRIRADLFLVEKGFCETREKARRLIIAGKVRSGPDRLVAKPSETISPDTEIILDEAEKFVGRGALKLLSVLEKHLNDFSGLTALDLGASTGGFTDLMLQKGASKVYAVDSGTSQLHDKLRNDIRVVSSENTNARYLGENFLPEKVDVVTMDLSFISATKVLPSADKFLKPGGIAFILVKPQFEAERKDVGKGGVVKDENVIQRCISKVADFAENKLGWGKIDIMPSTLKGPKGNQEYFIVFRKVQH